MANGRTRLIATCRTKEVDNREKLINIDLVYTTQQASVGWYKLTTKSNIKYDA